MPPTLNSSLLLTPVKNKRTELLHFVDKLKHTTAGLRHTKQFDLSSFLTSMITPLLPKALQVEWEIHTKDSKAVPAFDDFITFVAFRADVLTTTPTTTSESKSRIAEAKTEPPARKHRATVHSSASRPSNNTTRTSHNPSRPSSTTAPSTPGFRYECMLCPGSKHPLFVCTVFNQMSIQGRKEHIWSKNLCSNCLAPGHQNRDCRSWASCRQCGGRHHSLIHKERRAQPSVNVITTVINDTLLPVETVPLNCSVVANSNITGLINPSINVISPNTDGPITNPINPITNSLSPPNCLMMTSKVLIKGPGVGRL